MSSRRTFLKTSGAVAAGIGVAPTASASTNGHTNLKKYRGPHEMPTDVTLLAMQNADFAHRGPFWRFCQVPRGGRRSS